MKKLDKIANLLPEGLTEESVIQIADLVSSLIEESVEAEIKTLSSKVMSFLKLQKQSIKEQALQELTEESETYRNAMLFEEVRTLMSLELNSRDEDRAISKVQEERLKVEEDMKFLVENFEATLEEKESQDSVIEHLKSRVQMLEEERQALLEDNETLQDAVMLLEEESEKPFESSERAIVISENRETIDGTSLRSLNNTNEFLTEEILNLIKI